MSQTGAVKTNAASAATVHRQALPDPGAVSLRLTPRPEPELRNGDIVIEVSETPRPPSLLLRDTSVLSGWAVVANAIATIEKEMRDAGWVFFFMAGEIRATALGFDPAKALQTAATQLAGQAKAERCNAFEITRIRSVRFLGISRVSICAHARHLQKGSVFFGR